MRDWLYDFTTAAVESGSIKVLKPDVVARGIEETQKILDHHASGNVSASKPVLLV